ncbi:MAG TPA: hypothetical protein VHE12_06385 [bacterium]|nr:hypothetical protein [bacterium]
MTRGTQVDPNKTALKALLAAMAFLLLLVIGVEGFVHHHRHGRTQDGHCAYCHWNHSGSQGIVPAVQPELFPVYWMGSIIFKETGVVSAVLIFNPGRDPPGKRPSA